MIKTCPICSRQFECTGDDRCNCLNVKTNPEKLKEIREKYTGCLCPKCLEKLTNNDNMHLQNQ